MDDLVRIGDKLVSRRKVSEAIDRALSLRGQGSSQQEVARLLQVDRSFVSWLEKLGAVRRGRRVAVVGFPVANKDELCRVCEQEGVDFSLIWTDRERWQFVEQRTGIDMLDELMGLIKQVRDYDAVVFLGSDERLRVMTAMMDRETVTMSLGRSPLRRDVHVDPEQLRRLIQAVKR